MCVSHSQRADLAPIPTAINPCPPTLFYHLVSFYTVEDSFIVGKKLHLTKSGGLRSWKPWTLKSGGLEPRSLTEVYAYVYLYQVAPRHGRVPSPATPIGLVEGPRHAGGSPYILPPPGKTIKEKKNIYIYNLYIQPRAQTLNSLIIIEHDILISNQYT